MLHSLFRRLTIAVSCVLLLLISLPLTISPLQAFAQSSTVSINPTQGPVGSAVTGSGTNWTAGDQMQVTWDDGTILANTTVRSDGTFTVNFNIPSSVGQGGHDIYFTDLNSRYFLVAVFTVTSNTPTVTVQKVWTADGNNKTKTTFRPGDAIHYMVQVNNTNSTTVTATFTFLATGPQQIFSSSSPVSVPPGTASYYSPSTVPKNAPVGTYTLTVTVTYNGASPSGQSQFKVKAPCPVITGSGDKTGHCYVVVTVTAPSGAIGASTYMQVYKPTVASGDLESVAQLTVFNKDIFGDAFDIEVGWIVAPNQYWIGPHGPYKDSNTHLFVFVRDTAKASPDNACLVQPAWTCGFVPAPSATDFPGEILSLPEGTVKTFYVVNNGGNWWIQYDANWIGYIDGSWFNGQFNNVASAGWQGEIATISSNPTTQMGNGTCGTKTGPAHFYTMQVETATMAIDAGKLPVNKTITDTNFYNGKFSPTTSGTGSTLAYGGPTGCP